MSEELAGTQEAQIPTAEQAAIAAPSETTAPVVTTDAPAPEAAPAVEVHDAETVTTEAAPAVEQPAPEVTQESPTAESPSEPAAAAEQQTQPKTEEPIVISDEDVEKAITIIKETHKAGCAFMQRKMKWPFKRTVALLNALTEKGVLGPQVGTYPRKILIELPELPPKAPVAPKANQPMKPKITVKKSEEVKPPMSDADRKERWEANLRRVGKYTNETFIGATSTYALKHGGFNKRCKWGSALIVMINRLAGKTLDGLKTFTRADADHIQVKLMEFNQNNPLGDNVNAWNDTNVFKNNFEQRKAVKKFFGIECSFRDMKPEDRCLTAVVDAAWPNLEEEKRGTGGTFAERFVYLSLYIISMWTGDETLREGLFANSFHDAPTAEWTKRLDERMGRRSFTPVQDMSWIHEDGTCECGQALTKDSRGNTICSSPICEHHYASVGGDTPESFRNGNRTPRRNGGGRPDTSLPEIDPDKAPLGERTQRKDNWKKNRHDRHNDGDGDDFQRMNRQKKHGPRYRVNDGDESDAPSEGNDEGVTFTTSGSDGSFGSLAKAFEGLHIPVIPADNGGGEEVSEQLPPPPAEVPVP